MSLKKYLKAISELGAVSETALYTPLANFILSGPLNYSAKHYAINKKGEKGTPDIRIFSGEDNSEWVVCEAKLHDDDIRRDTRRKRVWEEQIEERGYIRAETFYVLLCAPRTFYVCDLNGDILDGLHIEGDELQIGSAVITGEEAALRLLRLALIAWDKDEIPVEEIQNLLLPSDQKERTRIADEIAGLASKLEQTKQRMTDVSEEIDEIIAAGLGLTPREHEVIRKRCEQFPLSVTIERPRYVWSPDRKRQARRIYEPGKRFK